jgi:precorrin-6A/cobalt-precorrin-6A reductase
VTKDSGGSATAAKLTAARELSVPVVLVRRPELPPGVDTVAAVPDAVSWLRTVV